MNLNYLSITEGGNSLVATLRSYFARYKMLLYILFAAATSLSVAWNWNWLTGAEVFRIMAWLLHDAHVHEARCLQLVISIVAPARVGPE